MADPTLHHARSLSYPIDDQRRPWCAPLTTSNLEGDNGSIHTRSPVSAMSRRTSFDSDRLSAVSSLTSYFPSNPSNVRPAPVYVAPFGASQVAGEYLGSKRRSSSDEEDDEQSNKDDVRFNEPALALVNSFLDQLLYSFLSTARSTNLSALRPAVAEVLKHRLGRDAITSAEEELAELLAGGEDDEEDDRKNKTAEDGRKWDLELVWKRTRLRVMVYMRLGEMEDEDEQRYVKEEQLFHGNERRFSQQSGLVSWATAIFLTSVLEYVAEQTLQVAGQAAYTRARRQSRSKRLTSPDEPPVSGPLVVEEYDVEKVALNPALGRLWRTWRKALRNNAAPTSPAQRSWTSYGGLSRENMVTAMSHRRSSFSTAHEGSVRSESRPGSREQNGEIDFPEHVLAANIPLPLGNATKDVDEIMVPGLATDPDDELDSSTGFDDEYSEDHIGSLVPLPITDEQRDVDEIEVPGLARDPDATDESSEPTAVSPSRRRSLPPTASSPSVAQLGRQRSRSVDAPKWQPIYTQPERDLSSEAGAGEPSTTVNESDLAQQGKSPSQEDTKSELPRAEQEGHNTTGSGDERQAEFPWMVAGATVASVAGAGWVASSLEGKDHPSASLTTGETVQDSSENAQQEQATDTSKQTPTNKEEVDHQLSAVPDQSLAPRPYTEKDIEELDRRKSLLDIKALMIVNSPSNLASGQQSPQTEDLTRQVDHNAAAAEPGSRAHIHEERQDPVDVAPSSVTGPSVIGTPAHARGLQDPPTRLAQGDTADEAVPVTRQTSKSGRKTSTSQSTSNANANHAKPHNAVSQPRGPNETALRLDTTAGSDQNFSKPPKRTSAGSTTSKRSSTKTMDKPPKSPKSPRLLNPPDGTAASTSASIRGPEDFDTFVQGGDTVKYTLTPQTVRDDPSFGSAQKALTRQSPVEMDATAPSNSPSSRAGRSHASRHATALAVAGADDVESRPFSSRRSSINKPSPRNVSAHRKSGLTAREPRVLTESTRDFADFIRSTGPGKEKAVQPILSNASQTSLHSLRNAHIQGASASRSSSPTGERNKSTSHSIAGDPEVPPVPRIPSTSKQVMQPRAAKAATTGSSDLIDFIRSGPAEEGKRRISRSVAPFRSTMDSDQLRDLTDKGSMERSMDSRMTNSSTSVINASVPSSRTASYNSRSALVNGSNRTAQSAYNNDSQRLPQGYGASSRTTSAQNSGPSRKQVRNKDPYSMDFLDDDDDEDDLVTPTSRPSRAEESLADFLRNHEPPVNNDPQPIVSPNSVEARNAAARVRAISGHQTSHSTNLRTRSVQSVSRPQQASQPMQPKMQARGGAKDIATTSNTRDLADFFKSSGPEDLNSAPSPSVGRGASQSGGKAEPKKKGGFFSRGLKRSKTYLDLP